MRSARNALEVDQLSRVFDVSAPWLNRMIDRKPKRYLHVVQDVALVIERGKSWRLGVNPAAASPPWRDLSSGSMAPVKASSCSGRPQTAARWRRR